VTVTLGDLCRDPHPALRCGTRPVLRFDSSLAGTLDEMFVVMALANGVGLAAPQVGIALRMFVLEAEGVRLAVVNPRITERHHPYHPAEACLSVPGGLYTPLRHRRIRASWQDATGAAREEDFSGLIAEIWEHEVDHLDGRLLYDLPQGSATEEQ